MLKSAPLLVTLLLFGAVLLLLAGAPGPCTTTFAFLCRRSSRRSIASPPRPRRSAELIVAKAGALKNASAAKANANLFMTRSPDRRSACDDVPGSRDTPPAGACGGACSMVLPHERPPMHENYPVSLRVA